MIRLLKRLFTRTRWATVAARDVEMTVRSTTGKYRVIELCVLQRNQFGDERAWTENAGGEKTGISPELGRKYTGLSPVPRSPVSFEMEG